ncbi:uncharacterized protein LOC142167210 [Nicotiana tabacum]|uniref:Uncharacterized protein LOC142167210 n=1 Tax=Nicotiana tabacum TaxID=4097 RepID=A0AC58SES3_TOBAC
MPCDYLDTLAYESILVMDSIVANHVYHSFLVTIGGYETRVDLLSLDMIDFDVILSIDWLSPYHTILYSHAKTVMLAIPWLLMLEWRGSLGHVPSIVVSFLKSQWMIENGCLAYLAFVKDVSADNPTVDLVPMVREFSDVFPADLPGRPPVRDIDFGIDLPPGTQNIFIPSYHMAPVELKESK